jgi:hypothetical protein
VYGLGVMFRIQNGLKQGDALLPSPLNVDLEYPIVNDQEGWEPLQLNEK